jgi:hypothetical protein
VIGSVEGIIRQLATFSSLKVHGTEYTSEVHGLDLSMAHQERSRSQFFKYLERASNMVFFIVWLPPIPSVGRAHPPPFDEGRTRYPSGDEGVGR